MKILCRTLFDCSHTGITGHFRPSQLPFQDQTGKIIQDQSDWNFARNQQRNWESIMQVASLRAQPTIIEYPKQINNEWRFVFEVEGDGVYSNDGNVNGTGALAVECAGTPMITGLKETTQLDPQLIASGNDQNIWFESVNKE
jgi:hypothetical protein